MELLSFLIFTLSFCLINFLLFPLAIIKLKSIRQKSHRNFWYALLQLHICLIGIVIANFIMAVSLFFDASTNVQAHVFHKSGNILATLFGNCLPAIFFLIVIERIFATVHSDTYEKSKNLSFVIIGSSICWAYAIFNILAWNVWILDISILGKISYGVDVAAVLATLILWKTNSNLKVINQQTKLELSRRYQIDENIRMIQHVLPFLLLGAACLIISGVISDKFPTIFLSSPDFFTWPLIYFSPMNVFIFLIFCFDIITKGLPWLFFPKQKTFFHRRVWATDENKQNDLHFKQLRSAWS